MPNPRQCIAPPFKGAIREFLFCQVRCCTPSAGRNKVYHELLLPLTLLSAPKPPQGLVYDEDLCEHNISILWNVSSTR